MKTITKHLVALILTLSVGLVSAQEQKVPIKKSEPTKQATSDKQIEIDKLEASKKQVEQQERDALKEEIELINKRLDDKKITAEEAQDLKKEAAKKRAANIADRLAIIDNKIALLRRNSLQEISENEGYILRIGGSEGETNDSFVFLGKKSNDKPKKYDRRTTDNTVFAIGFNNAIIDGQNLDDSPYKLGGSGFVELGHAWKTRVFKNSNFLRVKYGFSFQWNKLNVKDNQFFVNNNGDISLETFPDNVDKVKFRTTNLVFPVHFEFGPSKKIERDDYFRYTTHNQFKFGIGGYAGLNIGSLQKIKYEDANGNDIKDKLKGNYNTSDLVYGISGYVAFGGTALYVKYDLNPIFKNQAVEQRNISVGLRFDMD